jgi:hypothetical protein
VALVPGEYIVLDLPEQFCPICEIFSGKMGVCNEIIFTDDNEFLGVQGVVRFEDCGHRVPNSFANPWSIAGMLENMEDI